MNRQLRPDQQESIDSLRATIKGDVRRIMFMAPTAWGKTVWAAHVIGGCLQKGKRCTFVVDSISLIDQTIERLYEDGITEVGVIQADHHMQDWSKPVQIASVQTLQSRKKIPESDLVIIDEAHVMHKFHKEWLEKERGSKVVFIGLSATPFTRGLGERYENPDKTPGPARFWDTILPAMTTQEAIAKGILCPPRVFSASHPDLKARLKKVKVVANEYVPGELSTMMKDKTLTGDVVRTWRELWGKGHTLCFGVDRTHAKALQERFIEAGVTCAYQDGETDRVERAEIKRRYHAGDYQVVCSVGTMTKGVDWDVRCISLARPTKSRTLFKQIVGRGLRLAEGKEFCLVLDHGRCTQELGFVTEIETDHLDDGKTKQSKRSMAYAKECPKCHQFRTPGKRVCENCGFEPRPQCGWIETDDELSQVDRCTLPKKKKHEATMEEKAAWFAQLKGYAQSKLFKLGWAANKYRERFDVWPHISIEDVPPKAPSAAVLQWIKASQIRWAKSKNNPHNKFAPKPKPVDPAAYAGVPITRIPEGARALPLNANLEDALAAWEMK